MGEFVSNGHVVSQSLIHARLLNLTNRTGYDIVQSNGQRVYGPRSENEKQNPKRGCEVFVGRLPRDVYEDDIVSVFETIGKIYQVRLMIDFLGRNRGFCFVSYFNPDDAKSAVTMLNGYEIRPRRFIGVYKSLDNRRLFVGNLPTDKTKEDIQASLEEFVEGIVEVILYPSHENKRMNRGFAFVEFESHRHAAMARRKLSPGSIILWGVPILVDWADPVPEVDPGVMSKVTKLYMRNLDLDASNQDLWNFLVEYLPQSIITKTHKSMDYAFIHFDSRKSAEYALEVLKGKQFCGTEIEVSWARPRIYSKNYRLNNTPDHFCTSLPPKMRKLVLDKNQKNESPYDLEAPTPTMMAASNYPMFVPYPSY